MLNTKKIKARMVECGVTQRDVANKLEVALPTASQKINGIRPLYLDEAEKLADLLAIEKGTFGSYFFAQ